MKIKSKTIGDLRKAIEGLPDDMPIYLDDECFDECIAVLSFKQEKIGTYDPDPRIFELSEFEAFVLHYKAR